MAGQTWHTWLTHSCCCRSWGNKRRRTLRGASASPPGPPALAPASQGTLSAPASVLCLDEAATGAQAQADAPHQVPSRVEVAAGQPVILWHHFNCAACHRPVVPATHSLPMPSNTLRRGSATLSFAAPLTATSHWQRSSTLTCTGSIQRDSPVHCLSLVVRLQMLIPHRLS